MRIVIFTQSVWSIPTIQKLTLNNQLKGVVVPAKDFQNKEMLLELCAIFKLELFRWDGKGLVGITRWLSKIDSDRGLSFGFSYKIPNAIFGSFQFGVLNIHYGKLPAYAGAAPLFWTMKNGEKHVTITFHQIDENWDAGRMVKEVEVPIFPGEPIGLLSSRLSAIVVNEILDALEKLELEEGELITSTNQILGRPKEKDLTIVWENQTADEIELLVNASNPHYGGAITSFRENQIRILEVSPADVNVPGNITPGTIVYADTNYGIFVLCSDLKYLRINIFQLEGTVITGIKLASLGVKPNERLV